MIGRTCWVFVVACFVVLLVFSNGLHERAGDQRHRVTTGKSPRRRPIVMVSGIRPPHLRTEAFQHQNQAAVRVLHLDWLQEELLFQSSSSPVHAMENRSTCSRSECAEKTVYCHLGGNFRGQDEVHPPEDLCAEAWPGVQLC